jgi:rhomboid protease GluP
MCPNCRAFITTADKTCPYCEAEVGARAVDTRTPADVMGGLIPHARFTTVVILLINTGLYLLTVLHGARSGGAGLDPTGESLLAFGAMFTKFVAAGEYWRLITAGFLHGGIMHILMNSWVLFDLGATVEEAFGTARYLVLYFIATITGFLASFSASFYLFHQATLSMGASAGISGLIGAMIAWGIRERSFLGTAVRKDYTRWAIYMVVLGVVGKFFGIPIDNAAHIGGFVGGFLIAYGAGTPGRIKPLETGWKVIAGFCVVMTAAAFAQVVLNLTAKG